jgi:predicted GNAT family acetyltransferase
MLNRANRGNMMQVTFNQDLIGVDWLEMKETLAQDKFDNGRSPDQLERSFANSYCTCIAYVDLHIVGTARALSDGVCNAYIVDVWTLTEFRNQGIARTMLKLLIENLQGQHVFLWSDGAVDFYKRVGFVECNTGLAQVVGQWLVNHP